MIATVPEVLHICPACGRRLAADTLICVLKTHEDRAQITRDASDRLLGKVA